MKPPAPVTSTRCVAPFRVTRPWYGPGPRRARVRRSLPRAMSRVLVTGGVGAVGSAIVRRLLRDPDYEVRLSDSRPAPMWMREGCEVHIGDLRSPDAARRAVRGCSQV